MILDVGLARYLFYVYSHLIQICIYVFPDCHIQYSV